jgi:uncharacterized protein YraI
MTFAVRLGTPFRLAIALIVALLVAMFALQDASAALDPGTNATVRTDDGSCLRMRAQASLQGAIVTCVPNGSTVQVLVGSTTADGFQWQRIQYGGQSGWSVEQYLVASSTPTAPSPQQPAPTAAPAALPTPTLTGSLPSGGGFGLAVWSGGPIDRIPPLGAQRGCALRAVWVTQGGDFLGYVFGAPNVVNAPWNAVYPDGSLAPNSAIIVVCAAAGAATPPPPAQGPAPGPVGTPGVPPGMPNTPPGPAGNG